MIFDPKVDPETKEPILAPLPAGACPPTRDYASSVEAQERLELGDKYEEAVTQTGTLHG